MYSFTPAHYHVTSHADSQPRGCPFQDAPILDFRSSTPEPPDAVALNAWYAVQATAEMSCGARRTTLLLDTPIDLQRGAAGAFTVTARRGTEPTPAPTPLPSMERYGYVWTSLGRPPALLFDIPEYLESDRRNMNGASIAVRTSAPRVVENFLDLGHFAMVHPGYLGAEPHTEIRPYRVSVAAHELLATECHVYQPVAAPSAKSGLDVAYTYRVPHPFCAILYKSCALDVARRDVVGIFVQPATQERCIAHMFLCMLDAETGDAALKAWQQLIFGQDKPILENQIPARLPLNPRAEISLRADATSVAYRRWLHDRGVRYGTISADTPP